MTSEQTIALITGANRGIGYEIAANLLRHSSKYHILLASRILSSGQNAATTLSSLPDIKGSVEAIQLDVTSDSSVDAAAAYVSEKYGRLDILVNNAGMFPKNPIRREALRSVLETNVVGSMSVTESFLPLLRESQEKRLVFVSSSVGSISQAADPESKYYNPGAIEYRSSKAAVNMMLVQYWVALQKEGFKVLGADPGLCATDFLNKEVVLARGAVGADVGGERVAVVVRGERDGEMGRVWGEYGLSPW
ncbi:related to dehydrogenases with different specificities (related to short-chain alcohol dehydrogenases) [Phialocephala subalpina]|uniref:Related to dehydrogenases with different specificities (Related to short-chain alcohol dehydrogenases) n=1 Tax=Phialocephala subalpina TaxID=576137 RepID=A0A1L7XFT0_9HELO|nr:related to dehydrogenases with different specificities (related to short-chain alcohol dehydrogenases) [Phialocephala subalpina]